MHPNYCAGIINYIGLSDLLAVLALQRRFVHPGDGKYRNCPHGDTAEPIPNGPTLINGPNGVTAISPSALYGETVTALTSLS